jgi:hypothetical protein
MSIEENIELEIKNRFYYIEYPDGVGNYLWKNRNGNTLFTDDMTLDHLEKCIHFIHARCALVGATTSIGMRQDVFSVNLVVQRVETIVGFTLRFCV